MTYRCFNSDCREDANGDCPACDPSGDDEVLVLEIERLRKALRSAVAVADEAREEWDAAPAGMKAGKLLIALSGGLPGYRGDIDEIHAALGSDNRERKENG